MGGGASISGEGELAGEDGACIGVALVRGGNKNGRGGSHEKDVYIHQDDECPKD